MKCFRSGLLAPMLGLGLVSFVALPGGARAAEVEALFDLGARETGPFPADVFTMADASNLTGLRMNLPMPDCSMRPSDCEDVAVINTLDGFNLQPRISLAFSGPIDPGSANSSNVFLVNLGDVDGSHGNAIGAITGINQIVLDPLGNTLFAESDVLLDQHTRYALVATDGLRDRSGASVGGTAFQTFLAGTVRDAYREAVIGALATVGIDTSHVVAASVFTTQSATTLLENVRAQIAASTPAPANFTLGNGGVRTAFPLASIASLSIQRQVGTAPQFAETPVALAAFGMNGVVSSVAFGSYSSPSFPSAGLFIPPAGTKSGGPKVQGMAQIFFNLFLPAGPRPAAGWPVAIFGHGFGGDKTGANALVASLAQQGIATIAINVVGHGGGIMGTITVNQSDGTSVVLPAGGRGLDVDGDGMIAATEGVAALPPSGIIGSRDGLRQTVIDLMQLVHVIRSGGMDADGDGTSDLDGARIFYTGISFGGIYGTILLGVESDIVAGVPNVAGGPTIDITRFSPNFRPMLTPALALRTPSLLNTTEAPDMAPQFGFDENLPLRDQAPLVNDVPGALALQEFIDNSEWVGESGDPVAYAPHIARQPLGTNAPKPLIFQFARGDMTVPNPTSAAIVRAGGFADRVTFFRNDLFLANLANHGTDPAVIASLRNPHGFLARIGPGPGAVNALAAQAQIAAFFASNGQTTIDPDGAGPLFETPIKGAPLPEDTGFAPVP